MLCGVWAAPVFSLSDEDSTRTPPTFKSFHFMKAAALHWHNLLEEVRCAWKKRAVKLNMMAVPGKFRSFPREISKEPKIVGNRMLEELVLETLGGDWAMVCKKIRSAIFHKPRVVDSQRECFFGKELVVMQNQAYRQIYISRILKAVFFGPSFEKLDELKLIYKKRRY